MSRARWLAVALALFSGAAYAEDLPLNAAQFAGMMKQDDTDEIQLARQVAEKTHDTSIRAYAQELASDHQRALDELQSVADKAGLDLGKFDSKQLTAADQKADAAFKAMRAAVLAADGKDLDQLFLGYSLAEHDHDLQTLTEGQQKFSGTELGGLISRTLPMIRGHRARAYLLLKETGPQRQGRRP